MLSDESSGKGSVKSSEIQLELSDNPGMTISMLAEALGKSTRAVGKQLSKLKQSGKIERVGGRN